MSVYKGDKLVAGRVYEEIVDKPITLNSNFNGAAVLTKKSNITTLTFYGITAVSATGSSVICTLPEGIRPVNDCYFILWGDNDVVRIVYIKSDDGTLNVSGTDIDKWFDNGKAITIWGTISFIAQ